MLQYFECDQGFGRLTPSMSAVATWREWYLFSDRINNSRDEKLNHDRRITGLDKLVESGSDPRDYSLTTLFIGHKNLPVELSVF